MKKIGFTTVTFRQLSRRQVCETASANGIKYLEWGGDIHLPPDDKEALDEVIALQKEFGIEALSYGSYYRLGQHDIPLWNKIVDTAYAIGAKKIRIWQGSVSSSLTDEKLLEDMVNETRQLAAIAGQKGITVAFEFHNRTNNDNALSCIDFLKRVNMDNVKTYWQPLSVHSDNSTLKKILPYVVTVHIFTWRRDGERYSLKHGEKKWLNFFNTIKEGGAEPDFIMEFVKNDSPLQFAADAAVLKGWLDEREGK